MGLEVRLEANEATVRQGTVVPLDAQVVDFAGNLLPGIEISVEVTPPNAGLATSAAFVGYATGPAMLVARAGQSADTVMLEVVERAVAGSLRKVGEGLERGRYTTDLWVYGDYAYTGTRGVRTNGGISLAGDRLFTWDIRDPVAATRVHELALDAGRVNDVKIRATGDIAIATHEGSADGLNGITILDLANPAAPTPLARYTDGLESGVHNVWIEGDFVYAIADDHTGLHVVDVSDPLTPVTVSSFVMGEEHAHDVYVRDGLAFVSYWNEGLVILDVGDGIMGGSPAAPQLVSVLADLGGQTHNAWYWPDRGYVFVGEEDFDLPGFVHVVDARDLRQPREVARFVVDGRPPPHNFWVDEARGLLYVAWYGEGLRVVDVGGELLGELHLQGREVAGLKYNGGTGSCDPDPGVVTCTWAPQLHRGTIWVSDINSGIIALELEGGPGPG